MSTMQNIKNFIRHGKQARDGRDTKGSIDQPAVNNINVTQQAQPTFGITQPNLHEQRAPQNVAPMAGGFSVADLDDAADLAPKAGMVAAKAAETKQKYADNEVLERIVAEEREAKGKLPRYPGLERYQLIEKMGDGAFSNVYRARDLKGVYTEVAIKVVRKFEMGSSQTSDVMHPDFKKAPKTVERANILKEVQIMRQLDHPNVVKLVEFQEANQYYYIVLELCPGGELFHQIVRLTYFSENLSRHVIVQVAKALEYLHEEAGVVHRDIKPENLLFYPTPFISTRNPRPKGPDDEDKADEGEFIKGVGAGGIGVIKIADFGLSKVIWDNVTMTPCGTVGYTAPEIVKDERYSKSVDMWALGCVLYTLLCGFPPFYDESIQVLTEKVARGQYTFLSPWWDDISKSAQDLVSHLLTVDPDKRYDIKQFLNHPWIRESEEETSAAADAPPLATPLYRQGGQLGQNQLLQPFMDETPTGGRRQDFRSPGAVNLREIFDVGYAVHRQEEETKRRKNFKQGFRGGIGGGLNNDEDDGDEEDYPTKPYTSGVGTKLPKSSKAPDVSGMGGIERGMQNTSIGGNQARSSAAQARMANAPQAGAASQPKERGYGQHSAAVAAAAKKQVKNKGPFELSLDNATLLGRRGKKVEPSTLREQMVR